MNCVPTGTVPNSDCPHVFRLQTFPRLLLTLPCSGPITRPFLFDDHPPAKESSPSPPPLWALPLYLLPPASTPPLACFHCSSRLILSHLRLGEPHIQHCSLQEAAPVVWPAGFMAITSSAASPSTTTGAGHSAVTPLRSLARPRHLSRRVAMDS